MKHEFWVLRELCKKRLHVKNAPFLKLKHEFCTKGHWLRGSDIRRASKDKMHPNEIDWNMGLAHNDVDCEKYMYILMCTKCTFFMLLMLMLRPSFVKDEGTIYHLVLSAAPSHLTMLYHHLYFGACFVSVFLYLYFSICILYWENIKRP